MAYQKTQWVDGLTPINNENLNKMEQGIYQNSVNIENIDVTSQVDIGVSTHNLNKTSHDDIRKAIPTKTSQLQNDSNYATTSQIPDISSKVDKAYVDTQDKALDDKFSILSTDVGTVPLTTTAKNLKGAVNELDSEVNVLSDRIPIKPRNWKDETALFNDFPDGVYSFLSESGFDVVYPGGACNVLVEKTQWYIKQTFSKADSLPIKWRAMKDSASQWEEVRTIATTEKIDILSTDMRNQWVLDSFMKSMICIVGGVATVNIMAKGGTTSQGTVVVQTQLRPSTNQPITIRNRENEYFGWFRSDGTIAIESSNVTPSGTGWFTFEGRIIL